MIDLLFNIHSEVISNISTKKTRYLYRLINWDSKAICILGDRGVGKTTLMCQYLIIKYKSYKKALYISADNINVLSYGLFYLAQEYFSLGGEALFIDEVHKYPNWSIEIKNILDTYKKKQVIFSGSSSLDLNTSKADLSRRVVYYNLKGLSFREFLFFNNVIEIDPINIEDIINNHIDLAEKVKPITVLKHFNNYLEIGYYPFYLESEKDFLLKLNNVIEKVITEDIATVYNLKQNTLPVLKKILWLISSSEGLILNVDKISRNIGVSRDTVYNCFEYLSQAGLIINIIPYSKGMKVIRKPGKIFLNNTNLIYAINTSLKLPNIIGNVRETFFVNQTNMSYKISLHNKADFVIDNNLIFEIGGKNKDFHQLSNNTNEYLAIDGIEIGVGNKIPLYLFGFLY